MQRSWAPRRACRKPRNSSFGIRLRIETRLRSGLFFFVPPRHDCGMNADEKIIIADEATIHPGDLHEDFIRSSGPGGQNVNKVATAVQLRFDAANAQGLSERVRERTIKLAGQRATKDGVIVIEAGRFRTQEQNRADARAQADRAGRQGGRAATAAAQEDQAVEGRRRAQAENQGWALHGEEAARPRR